MALLQSASDLAQSLFNDFKKRTVPTVVSAVGNDIKRLPIIQGINAVRQVAATPQFQQNIVTPIRNYAAQVQANKQQPFFNNTGNNPIQWAGKVIQDTQRRGPFEGLQDLSYPVLENPYVEPIEEPLVGRIRVANYKAGRPNPLINNLLGQTDQMMKGQPYDWQKQFVQPILNGVKNFSPGQAVLQGIPGGNQVNKQILKPLGLQPPTLNEVGKTLSQQNTLQQQMNRFTLKQLQGEKLSPQEQKVYKEGLSQEINAIAGVGGGGNDLNKAAFYLRSKLDPEAVNVLKNFATLVETKGSKAAMPRELATTAQAIMKDAFGGDAAYWTNQKMKNTIDLVLQRVGTMKNKVGLGLSVGNIREGSKETPQFDPQAYIQELTQKQKAAGSIGAGGLVQRGKNLLSEIKTKLIDSTAPIEDALSLAEKKYKFQVRPTSDIRIQIDRVLRSPTLAAQFAKDNGLENVIKNAPDLNTLDQYMIAKQAQRVAEFGKETGRNAAKDQQLVQTLAPQYEQLAQQVNQYSRKLLQYSVDSGLIDQGLANELIKKYPDYVPLQRVFNELEKQPGYKGMTKAVASLSKQSVVQKLEGSTREITSPIESLLVKTQDAFQQGEKNRAAQMLASYSKLPGLNDLIHELPSGESSPHTISFLDKGVKKTFATTPEIAAAAKNLNQEQMNIVLKMLSVPTRLLQLGATGLNVPFVVTNVAKDQMTAFVNSSKAARTSLLNPFNFGRALFSTLSHDKLYDEAVRNAALQTSFDISRSQPNLSVGKLRAGKSIASKIAYTVTRPQELLRSLENIVGKGEEVTRIQQYKGTYDALLKEGRTPADARLLAAKAAQENTANFARKGDIGKVINYVIPFFNAGIQGSRVLVRNFQTRPLQTAAKLAVGVFTPVAATTAWNMNDPQRKAVYQDISEFEKQNNLIIVPDGATKDAQGRWNVIKIPLPPGLSNLGTIVRRTMESAAGLDPVTFSDIANNLLTAGTSLDTSSPSKLASTFTPQAVKPFVESITNTNLFTGLPIVPDSMKNLPPQEQAKPYTSGTARLAGKAFNQSPLKVENFVRTSLGGLGSQLLNTSDTLLNKAGVIPNEQVGGESAGSQLARRFSKASGGAIEQNQLQGLKPYQEEAASRTFAEKRISEKVYTKITDPTVSKEEKIKLLQLATKNPRIKDRIKNLLKDGITNSTFADSQIQALPTEERAKYIKDQIKALKTREEKINLLNEYKQKGILTKDVIKAFTASKP